MGADQHHDWRMAAHSALQWWNDAGIDTLVEDEVRDWTARPAASSPRAVAASVATQAAAASAAAEALPDTLDAFVAWRMSDAAPDAGWSQDRIAPTGPADATLMVVTDMPDDADSEAGALLSGASGRLFDAMLAAIGVARGDVYMAALCVARPLAGRVPASVSAEIERIARHHVGLVGPHRLLLLGQTVAQALIGADEPMRGGLRTVNHGATQSKAIALRHPRFLLERPTAKGEAWRDLQLLIRGPDA